MPPSNPDEPAVPVATPDFRSLLTEPALLRALTESGHEVASHFQQLCIPELLKGRDILGMADVGSGKTMAFVLPLLQMIDLKSSTTQVLVLTPSDTLALHVAEVFQHYAKYLCDFRVYPVYHQTSSLQLRQLHRGPHVIIGTPRHVTHALESGDISLASIQTVVLDELARLLNEGFVGDIEALIVQTPKSRQLVALTSTITPAVRLFRRLNLKSVAFLMGAEKSVQFAPLRQRYWQIEPQQKLNALTRLIAIEPHFDAALICVASKGHVAELTEKLKARGYSVAGMNGDFPLDERSRLAQALNAGSLDLLVSTDLATEDLKLERLSHVISYDVPLDAESYVHRIEQLAYGGYKGSAILLIASRESGMLHSIEHATHQRIGKLELPERVRQP